LPLAALIAAQEPLESGDGLRATLPLAGRTLIEHQARIATLAGADRIILLVERIPAALAQAVDRLRRDGISVETARGVADAADRLHPDDRVLLIADGCIAGQGVVDRLAAQFVPAVLTLPDTPEQAMFERIDPESRWAGFALVGGERLRATVQMLGDWDLMSTLLRRSVQDGATRIDALGPGARGEAPQQAVIAVDAASLVAVEKALLRLEPPARGNWVDRYVYPLVAGPIVRPLILRGIDPLHIALGSAGLAWIGAASALAGYFWLIVLLLPLSSQGFAVARRMARIWSPDLPHARLLLIARDAAALTGLASLAWHLAQGGGWGWWLVAALIPSALQGLAMLKPIRTAIRPAETPLWLPKGDGLIWIAPVLAVLVGWPWMAALLAAYCAAGFGWQFALLSRQAAEFQPIEG